MKRVLAIIKYILFILAFAIILISQWVMRTWNGITITEILFQLSEPLNGTDPKFIIGGIVNCAVPLVIAILAIPLIYFFVKTGKIKGTWIEIIKAKRKIINIVVALVMTILTFISLVQFDNKYGVSEYFRNQKIGSSFVYDNYIDPANTNIEFPETKRNLIYIYLESMENTYSSKENGGAMDENVIPNLTELSLENECFAGDSGTLNGGLVLPRTNFTMGAMVAQTSGLPLSVETETIGEVQSEIYPGITTLGDILYEQGYNNELFIGSDAIFGGRKQYFSGHGDYAIKDYNYAIESGLIPSDYEVFWGYEDEKLFSFAKDELTSLAESGEPFNFTMLTVDTHFEDGYVCRLCGDEFGDNQYANVLACSDRQVYEFVRWIQDQEFYANTTIIISGDHLTMDSDFLDDIDEEYIRTTYTSYINAAATPLNNERRTYSTFDNFPTTLAALGCKIDGDRLGLGTNLFSDKETLTEEYTFDVEKTELSRVSNISGIVGGDSFPDVDKDYFIEEAIVNFDINRIKENSYELKMEWLVEYDKWLKDPKLILYDANGKKIKQYKTKLNSDRSYTWTIDATKQNKVAKYDVVVKVDGQEHIIGEFSGKEIFMLQDNFEPYLQILNDMENCAVFISARYDAGTSITDEQIQLLNDLGLKTNLKGKIEYSYAAAIIDGVVDEKLLADEQAIVYGRTDNGKDYAVLSAGAKAGSVASIVVDGQEYSLNQDGLNFVVYDIDSGEVIDQRSYNTNWGARKYDIFVGNLYPTEEILNVSYTDENTIDLAVTGLTHLINQTQTEEIYAIIWDEDNPEEYAKVNAIYDINNPDAVDIQYTGDEYTEDDDLYVAIYSLTKGGHIYWLFKGKM